MIDRLFLLHNKTFFPNFHKEDCRKKLVFFFHFTFVLGKKINFSRFCFSIQKSILHKFGEIRRRQGSQNSERGGGTPLSSVFG